MADTHGTDASTAPPREQWSGQLGFILSAIGSAVGLGNIWRFPGVAYENGGGAFLIPYLVALLTAGIPILLLDYSIGHRFRGAAPTSFRRLTRRAEGLGWFQVGVSWVIILYYTVIIAWAASYMVFAVEPGLGRRPGGFFSGYLHLPEATTVSTQVRTRRADPAGPGLGDRDRRAVAWACSAAWSAPTWCSSRCSWRCSRRSWCAP